MIGRAARLAAGALLLFSTFCPAFPLPADAQGSGNSFFNSVETRSSNLSPFKKWTGAMERFSEEKAKENKRTDCGSQKFNTCHYHEWQKFLDGLRGKPKDVQIEAVNSYANARPYISDPVNWHEDDYWETPGEFIARFGDCEDYAIIKYLSLKNLGFTDDELRLVAVKDLNLRVGHAVLVVFFKGKMLLLDNQIKKVVETSIVHHYEPVFSINQTYWWRHRPA
jgi:predicted transglutaminase-like cysteine proteinase